VSDIVGTLQHHGVTYPSPCARMAANVFLAHMGACSLDGGISILDARGQ